MYVNLSKLAKLSPKFISFFFYYLGVLVSAGFPALVSCLSLFRCLFVVFFCYVCVQANKWLIDWLTLSRCTKWILCFRLINRKKYIFFKFLAAVSARKIERLPEKCCFADSGGCSPHPARAPMFHSPMYIMDLLTHVKTANIPARSSFLWRWTVPLSCARDVEGSAM